MEPFAFTFFMNHEWKKYRGGVAQLESGLPDGLFSNQKFQFG
jgi:hypothetical protein